MNNCPKCNEPIPDATVVSWAGCINGRRKSARKAKSSRANGKKGGRPKEEISK